jgi:serine/threonine protein kinase
MELLEGPNVVRLYGYYHFNGIDSIIMEYIPGGDLFDYLKEVGFQYNEDTKNEAKKIMKGCLLGIKECHDKKLGHGDVKPENFLMGNEILIADFGWSFMDLGKNHNKVKYGTPEYTPPEFYTSKKKSIASDIWGCGIVLYEIITGKSPFLDKQSKKMIENIKLIRYDLSLVKDKLAKDFIKKCLCDVSIRSKVDDLLKHPFLKN